VGVGGVDPTVSHNRQEDVALLDSAIDVLSEIDTKRRAVDIEEDRALTETVFERLGQRLGDLPTVFAPVRYEDL